MIDLLNIIFQPLITLILGFLIFQFILSAVLFHRLFSKTLRSQVREFREAMAIFGVL